MGYVVAMTTAARQPNFISPRLDLMAEVWVEQWIDGLVTGFLRLGFLSRCGHLSELLSLAICLHWEMVPKHGQTAL